MAESSVLNSILPLCFSVLWKVRWTTNGCPVTVLHCSRIAPLTYSAPEIYEGGVVMSEPAHERERKRPKRAAVGQGCGQRRCLREECRAFGSWTNERPLLVFGGYSPVTACFSASMMVCQGRGTVRSESKAEHN